MNNILKHLHNCKLELITSRNNIIDYNLLFNEGQLFQIHEIDEEIDMVERFINDIEFKKSLDEAMKRMNHEKSSKM